MADQQDIKQFPDLSNKLAAPTKKSVFERQRAEAEAKRQREEAETAAVYDDFVKSFDDEDGGSIPGLGPVGRQKPSNAFDAAPRIPSGPSKRHFAPAGRSSGPGSLGPTPNLSRKRTIDGSRREERSKDRGILAFEDTAGGSTAADAFRASDDEDDRVRDSREAERAAAKPTLQLSSLPPGTSPAVIKSLISGLLTVDGARILPPSNPSSAGSTERRSMSAIVTLAQDTPATDIDTAVSSLQNRYLGWGFNLSISRHLSSASLGSLNASMPSLNSRSSSLPFNAQPVPQGPAASMSRAPPPVEMHRGGIAPPSSYNSTLNRGPAPVQVRVSPPSDIKQLKLIHKTVENLITHGPEFEALLMSRPEVQKEDRWAWIWNSRSTGAVYYRWRLWEVLTGNGARKSGVRYNTSNRRLFEGAATWTEPEEILPFEYTTNFDDFISDSEYNSSDEEDSADEGGPRKRRGNFDAGRGPPPEGILNQSNEDQTYLNPLQKAKLTHLLSRLPTTTARLRKGDVARVTGFAISHAGKGADEVVEMLVTNVLHPLSWSRNANPENVKHHDEDHDSDAGVVGSRDGHPSSDNKTDAPGQDDTSGSSMIAVHLISDILSASSTSGVRHAWRYRALFESALAERKVFAFLGRLEKTLKWGRLRAEKWKRSVNNILQLWEGWCVFPAAAQEKFVADFNKPPLTKAEEEEEEREKKQREKGKQAPGFKSKWKAVDVNEVAEKAAAASETLVGPDVDGEAMDEDLDGTPMEDIDGAPMDDIDGAPMEDLDGTAMDEDVDGVPMEDDVEGAPMDQDVDGGPMAGTETAIATATAIAPAPQHSTPGPSADRLSLIARAEAATAAAKARRSRPKAEDMFAESDDEG